MLTQKSIQTLLIAMVLMLGCLVAVLFSQNLRNRNVTSTPPVPGRYFLTVRDDNTQYITDAQTGRVWYRYGHGPGATWEEERTPDYKSSPCGAGCSR